MTLAPPPAQADGARVARRAKGLLWLTVAWNSAEAVVAVGAGLLAGSVALVGFGFDSGIEIAASLAALWALSGARAEPTLAARDLKALRIIGACFLLLAAWVLYEAAAFLVDGRAPERSVVGMALAGLSLVVMPLLVRWKRRVATRLGSGALEAEARQTGLCACLSAILLVGLGLNAALDWWWADPVAGIAMTPIIAREGWDAIRGKTCCSV